VEAFAEEDAVPGFVAGPLAGFACAWAPGGLKSSEKNNTKDQ
jgi:hypothetical protein